MTCLTGFVRPDLSLSLSLALSLSRSLSLSLSLSRERKESTFAARRVQMLGGGGRGDALRDYVTYLKIKANGPNDESSACFARYLAFILSRSRRRRTRE